MEDPLLRLACDSPYPLIEILRNRLSFIRVLFLDEIQHLEEAGLFIKGIVDARLGIPVFVTGSSSFDLRSSTRESLAGRATRRLLLPFDFDELCAHCGEHNVVARERARREIVLHQLIFGSYPQVYLSSGPDEKRFILNDLVEALILRDASDLFRIKRIDAFRRLLSLLAGQAGSLVNLSELAAVCGVDVGTISSYIEILEESHLVAKVGPFAGGKRREITGTPKVYFLDNGIRNQLLNNFSPDIDIRTDKGPLLENWVFFRNRKESTPAGLGQVLAKQSTGRG